MLQRCIVHATTLYGETHLQGISLITVHSYQISVPRVVYTVMLNNTPLASFIIL